MIDLANLKFREKLITSCGISFLNYSTKEIIRRVKEFNITVSAQNTFINVTYTRQEWDGKDKITTINYKALVRDMVMKENEDSHYQSIIYAIDNIEETGRSEVFHPHHIVKEY